MNNKNQSAYESMRKSHENTSKFNFKDAVNPSVADISYAY